MCLRDEVRRGGAELTLKPVPPAQPGWPRKNRRVVDEDRACSGAAAKGSCGRAEMLGDVAGLLAVITNGGGQEEFIGREFSRPFLLPARASALRKVLCFHPSDATPPILISCVLAPGRRECPAFSQLAGLQTQDFGSPRQLLYTSIHSISDCTEQRVSTGFWSQ